MAYGFNLDGFKDKDFVNQLHEMTMDFYSQGRTIDLIYNQPNNHNRDAINMFENNISLQDGSTCTFDPKGEVLMEQKYVRVLPLKVNDLICPKDLEKTFLSMMMTERNMLPADFARKLAESYLVKIRRFVEIYLWNGIDADGLQYDGLVKQIADSNAVIDASAEVESASTKIAKVNAMIAKMTADILESEDVRIFCSTEFFLGYIQELISANHYLMPETYNVGDPMKAELLIPGTNVRLTPVLGLDHITNVTKDDGEFLILTYSKNLVASYDGLGDYEDFSMIVNPFEGNRLQVSADFKLGSALKWDSKIIKGYTLVSAS